MNERRSSLGGARLVAAAALAASILVPAGAAHARGAGRARVPRRPVGEAIGDLPMKWYESLDDALRAAGGAKPPLPVLGFLRVAAGRADRYITATLFANKTIIVKSQAEFAAFLVDVGVKEARERALRWGVTQDGTLAWFDEHGDCVHKQEGRLSQAEFLRTVQYWPLVLDRHKKTVAKRVAETKRLIASGRHVEALEMLRPVIELRGPLAGDVRPLVREFEVMGNDLLNRVDTLEHGRTGRDPLLESIAAEYRGTSVEERARGMMKGARAATGAPAPGIDVILDATQRGAGNGGQDEAAAPPGPKIEIPAGVNADNPQSLLMAARERYGQARRISKAGGGKEGRARAFGLLTHAGDLASLAQEKRPRDSIIARLIESIAELRYECFKKM